MSHRSLRYLPALDGLRGIAVLAVVLFHGGVSWVEGGFLGVSTFFTLSGFLITSLLLADRAREGRIDLPSFWVRRVRRLLPASLVTLLAVAVIGRYVMPAEAVQRLPGDLLATVGYVANWRFIASGTSYADLFVAPSLVQHFWSLAIEEQFYLVFPIIAAVMLRLGTRALAALVVVITLVSFSLPFVAGFTTDRVYYGTDTRAGELAIGVLLAILWDTGRVRAALARPTRFRTLVAALGAVALVGSAAAWGFIGLHDMVLYQGGLPAYAVASAALVAACTLPGRVSPVAALLALAPFRLLGRISYGVYLIHWPVFLVLTAERVGVDGGALLGVRLAATLALALVSFFVVERPVRRGGVVSDRYALGLVPVAVVATVVLAFVVFPVGHPGGGRIAFAEENAAPPDVPPPVPTTAALDPALPDRTVRSTTTTAVQGPYRVLVVGTPETKAFADSFATYAGAQPAIEVTTSLSACGGARAESDVEFTTELDTCVGWVAAWTKAVETRPEVVVVLQPLNHTALMGVSDILLRKDAGALVDLLTSTGAKLVPVTLPGRTPQPFDTTFREVAGDAGADAGAVERLDAATAARDLYEAVLSRRPTPAPDVEAVDGAKKVMIVGDSVASNLGRALELWGRRTGEAVFWNAAALGCGIASGGVTNAQPPYDKDTQKCIDWRESWQAKVDEFDPDIVVVLTGAWDLPERSLPEWDGFQHAGDPAFDRWLVGQYQRAQEIFSSAGAAVVWLTAPCTGTVWSGFAISGTGAFDNERIDILDTKLLPQIADVTVVDLHRVACPSGEFTSELGGVRDARPDGLHFIEEAALFVADQIGPEIVASVSP